MTVQLYPTGEVFLFERTHDFLAKLEANPPLTTVAEQQLAKLHLYRRGPWTDLEEAPGRTAEFYFRHK